MAKRKYTKEKNNVAGTTTRRAPAASTPSSGLRGASAAAARNPIQHTAHQRASTSNNDWHAPTTKTSPAHSTMNTDRTTGLAVKRLRAPAAAPHSARIPGSDPAAPFVNAVVASNAAAEPSTK